MRRGWKIIVLVLSGLSVLFSATALAECGRNHGHNGSPHPDVENIFGQRTLMVAHPEYVQRFEVEKNGCPYKGACVWGAAGAGCSRHYLFPLR